ncbi:MAG: VCBS repeat-containing protein, partial [Planctomycetota bacterium]|nr:VCBS repeat-containing protein [Planctomycetota bacterium]
MMLSRRTSGSAALLAALLVPVGSAATPRPQSEDLVETRLAVAKNSGLLALRDLTGDGRVELLSVTSAGVLARTLGEDGTYPAAGTLLQWPAGSTGWDLADLDGDGRVEILMVSDGKTLVRRSLTPEGAWSEPETVLETGMYLPAATVRVPFTRDLDNDGRLDLVLPGPGRFHMRLNRGQDGAGALTWSEPIEVEYEPEIDYRTGDPGRLSSTFSQRVRVPWFSMDDIDGDGLLDLVSETSERVAFHLAKPDIDARPTWALDLSKLRSAPSPSDLDLDNLLGAVSGLAQWRAVDLDGEAPRDLIVSSEGTFK